MGNIELPADADLLRLYQYAFDLSGNRTQQIVTVAGSPTTTNYGYNAANQMTSAGAATLTYDNNGNLTSDGATAYTWDRANRMLGAGSVSYAYDGTGNRISQMVSAMVTQYLLDVPPGCCLRAGGDVSLSTKRPLPFSFSPLSNLGRHYHYSILSGVDHWNTASTNRYRIS